MAKSVVSGGCGHICWRNLHFLCNAVFSLQQLFNNKILNICFAINYWSVVDVNVVLSMFPPKAWVKNGVKLMTTVLFIKVLKNRIWWDPSLKSHSYVEDNLWTENPSKMMKNSFYFTSRYWIFVSNFWSCRKTVWLER